MHFCEHSYFSYGRRQIIESRHPAKDHLCLMETSAKAHICNEYCHCPFHVTSHSHPHPLSLISDIEDVLENAEMNALFIDVK